MTVFKHTGDIQIGGIGDSLDTHSNMLVGVVHHSDEHVEQNHHGYDTIGAKHGGTHKVSELVARFHIGHIDTDEPEYGPEQRLQRLKHPVRTKQTIVINKIYL